MLTNSQFVYEVFEHQKTDLLLHLMGNLPEFDRVMVFVRTRDDVHVVTSALGHADVRVESIHGNKKAELRDRAIREFNEGKIRVLVTTDAIARDIDVAGLKNGVNFDFPELDSDYLQRAERTSNAGGQVITLVTPKDGNALVKLEGVFGAQIPRETANDFSYATQPIHVKPQRKKGGKSKGLHSKPLQNKKPKFKTRRGRK
ncbi:MAG: C-terminal helicase domain-containing protein [Akkermansiaceae bacterium]|jgi:ATP-dependent RNA helicase RhlE